MSSEIAPEDRVPSSSEEAEHSFWTYRKKFPPGMETAFQYKMECMREQRMRKTGGIALALYGAYALSDRVMVPDVYRQAWMIRFLLVMPLMLVLTLSFNRIRSVVMREFLLAASVVIVGASLSWITALSRHPNATHYQAGITLVILFGNIVLGLRLRDAAMTSALMAVIYGVALHQIRMLSPEVALNNWLFYLSAAAISLIANFRMDQDQRRAYLAHAREQARNAELSDAVRQLAKLSAEDALTQIANRREFDRRLELEWGRAKRAGQMLALILTDVDCFKNYNDYYGHPAGDRCLQRIAATLSAIPQRPADLVARFGGEEFVVLLPGATLADAEQLAERMREAIVNLRLPHATSHVALGVTASFGVAALAPSARHVADRLLADADAALYRAKELGRNRVCSATMVA